MPSNPRQIPEDFGGPVIIIGGYGAAMEVAAFVFLLFARKNSGWLAIALLCGVCGLPFVLLAFVGFRRLSKYGISVFESQWLPASRGGVLDGTIRLPKPFFFREPIHIQFSCVRIIHGGRQDYERLIWEDHYTLDRFSHGAAVSEIPVHLSIPGDALPSGSGGIKWTLSAKAKTCGIFYGATFPIPVANDPVPAELRDLPDPTQHLRSPAPVLRQPIDRNIHFIPLSDGGGQFELLPARNRGAALTQIFLGGLAAGMGAFALHASAARNHFAAIHSIAFMFVGCGLIACLFGLRRLFQRTTITVRHRMIMVDRTATLLGYHRVLHTADIAKVAVRLLGGSSTQPLYSVDALRVGGGSLRVCRDFQDKSEAEWMAGEITRELAAGSGAPVLPPGARSGETLPK
jgi:hypothetical protein